MPNSPVSRGRVGATVDCGTPLDRHAWNFPRGRFGCTLASRFPGSGGVAARHGTSRHGTARHGTARYRQTGGRQQNKIREDRAGGDRASARSHSCGEASRVLSQARRERVRPTAPLAPLAPWLTSVARALAACAARTTDGAWVNT